jgi:hypothetical protein
MLMLGASFVVWFVSRRLVWSQLRQTHPERHAELSSASSMIGRAVALTRFIEQGEHEPLRDPTLDRRASVALWSRRLFDLSLLVFLGAIAISSDTGLLVRLLFAAFLALYILPGFQWMRGGSDRRPAPPAA